LDAMLLAVPR